MDSSSSEFVYVLSLSLTHSETNHVKAYVEQ